MKRTRRIEIVRYSRKVTLSGAEDASDRARDPIIITLLEALGDAAPATEEFHHQADAGVVVTPRPPFLRRLLLFLLAQDRFRFRSGDENTKKENEP